MARIIVIADTPRRANIGAPVLMNEEVKPDHLADKHASQQIIQRVAWAVFDAHELSPQGDANQVGHREVGLSATGR